MKIPKEKRDKLMDLGKSIGMTKIRLTARKDSTIKMRGWVAELGGWVTIAGEREPKS